MRSPLDDPRKRTRRTDPSTSLDAARSMSVVHMSRLRRQILACLSYRMTDMELERTFKLNGVKTTGSSLRSRRKELVDLGYVEAGGVCRFNGRSHFEWQRTDAGNEIVEINGWVFP